MLAEDYYSDGGNKTARYYQLKAINKTIEAIAKGEDRILLVMATGTGKTFTAFQIIWRLWKSRAKKRILFLADRNILVDQTMTNDFKPFGSAMTKIQKRQANKSYEIYLSLYQAVTGNEEEKNIYKQFSPGFFDLIVVDECHRGSAAADSAWRQILEYFSSAAQIGLTATPKETREVSNIDYFGEPVYTYSLKQGIEDGFLAPYKVVRIDIDKDLEGWRPEQGKLDKYGNEIEDRIYNQRDFDKTLVLEKRTKMVAAKVTRFLKETDRYSKSIILCDNIDHAERMRQAIVNANADIAAEDDGDEDRAVRKYYVDDVPVRVVAERVQYYGPDGKLSTESLKDYSRKQISKEFDSLDSFLLAWSSAERKKVIIDELAEQGIFFEALAEEVGQDIDPFDIVCHIAWDMPPLSRKERVEQVKKRNYFTKYGEQARKVMEELLNKYADGGIDQIEEPRVLTITPFTEFGTPYEIAQLFGGPDDYYQAIRELESQLYTIENHTA